MATAGTLDWLMDAGETPLIEPRYRAALDRIERGTFGLCIDCAHPVERRRLDADPFAERCAACARECSHARGGDAYS